MAALQALALADIAEHLENLSTLLATGLGKGSPLVEALRGEEPSNCPSCGFIECRCVREDEPAPAPGYGIRLIPTVVLKAELHRRGIEERPDNEDDRERERERERERVRAQMKEQERRP
jgi:hypothetical protein